MQMILHLNRGRPWHVVKKSQLTKVALAVVFKHLHKSPSTILSTFNVVPNSDVILKLISIFLKQFQDIVFVIQKHSIVYNETI